MHDLLPDNCVSLFSYFAQTKISANDSLMEKDSDSRYKQ